MKHILIIICLTLYSGAAASQTISGAEESRGNRWQLGFIPALAYDSDLGLKYGGVLNLFDYGKETSQKYEQYLFLRFTNTTRGSIQFQSLMESTTLLNKFLVLLEASYLKDLRMDFYGFNGLESLFLSTRITPGHPEFESQHFYSHQRELLRIRSDFQRNLAGEHLRLLTGYMFNRFRITGSDSANGGNQIQTAKQAGSLYELYKDWGIIPEHESPGGTIHLLKLGMVFDSRNDPCYCTHGRWIEGFIVHSPGFLSSEKFTKLVLTYRNHSSLANERFTLSYRLSIQHKISGRIPWYMTPIYFDSRLSLDGLGGAYSLRGAFRNRVVANGFLTATLELKQKISEFNWRKQHLITSFSLFYDNALITQPFPLDTSLVPESLYSAYFRNIRQGFHHTFGPGLYLVINKSNVITVNYGIPVDPQIGKGGLYVGSNMLF